MRATLFKEVSYSLSKLIQDIDMGEIGLPDIQRPFVWTSAKVRDLLIPCIKDFGSVTFYFGQVVTETARGKSGPTLSKRLLGC